MGPMIGAYFAMSSGGKGEALYFKPALFAITLAVADIIFIFFFFKETLPRHRRVSLRHYRTEHCLASPVLSQSLHINI